MSTLSHERYIEWNKYWLSSVDALKSRIAYAHLCGSTPVASSQTLPVHVLEGNETGGLLAEPG